jgi:hypothetical protein
MVIDECMKLPYFDKDFAKCIYETGKALIYDDKADLGFTSYKGRSSHKYHGKNAPNHPSPAHHWMAGTLLVMVSQFMALAATAQQAADAFGEDINNAL